MTNARNAEAVFLSAPVVPVIRIDRLEQAVPLARALVRGGLPVLEVTLRSDVALEAIRRIAAEVEGAVLGAGTVLNPKDLDAVIAAGCSFAISPGASTSLYRAAESVPDFTWIPAVATASELMAGMEFGHRHFKFFPAVPAGGVAMLKSFHGPFPSARFCPTGGIEPANAAPFFALENVLTVGGSWMLPAQALTSADYERIETMARTARALNPRFSERA
jgi:2-dehydro-3-deoxyphosphogluconate aldolase/(4S)-4-hydroxy-2-oxoglutarate aldolase